MPNGPRVARWMFLLAMTWIGPLPAAPQLITPGVELLMGTFPEGEQPDGNTIIFTGTEGLIVMDTGRHAAHTRQIIDFAQQQGRPIKAIINSHWHLDHIGGNSRIRSAYPDVRIYASGALEGALKGFLADYQRDLEDALHKMPDSAQASGWRDELSIIAAAPQSIPDERIDSSGTRVIAGRKLVIHMETRAATAGDVWVFDPATRIVAAGDLVTLPVPFLDTACARGWKSALDNISRTRFATLIPGHGQPMWHERFDIYRHAFDNLLVCAAAQGRSNDECTEGWIRDVGAIVAESDQPRARKMLNYYMTNSLRGDPARVGKLCSAQAG